MKSDSTNDKDEVDNTKISLGLGVLFAVYIAVFLTNHYIISFDEIKSKVTNLTQSIKSSPSAQTQQTQPTQQKQPQQPQPTKSAQSTSNMIRCDNKDLLNHLIKIDKNFWIDSYSKNIEIFSIEQEEHRKHGIDLTSVEELVNSFKYNIIKVQTKTGDEANREIVCEAEIETTFPINKMQTYYSVKYRAKLKDDNNIEFGILDN